MIRPVNFFQPFITKNPWILLNQLDATVVPTG